MRGHVEGGFLLWPRHFYVFSLTVCLAKMNIRG